MLERDDIEVHVVTCEACAGELAQYRGVLSALGSLRDELDEPPPAFAASVISSVRRGEAGWLQRARRLTHDRRIRVAAASLGGALVGAGAIAVLWWRATRRPAVGGRLSA